LVGGRVLFAVCGWRRPVPFQRRKNPQSVCVAARRQAGFLLWREFRANLPRFSQQIYALEIRPIAGWRNTDWKFITNPIVDVSFGAGGETDFLPALRLARNLGHDFFVGAEYYSDFGQIGNFLPLQEQQHTIFAVTDFKIGQVDVELGLGYGLTSGSDRVIAKTILGYAFPVPGSSEKDTSSKSACAPALNNPFARSLASEPWMMR
jgi:hypothetical protein